MRLTDEARKVFGVCCMSRNSGCKNHPINLKFSINIYMLCVMSCIISCVHCSNGSSTNIPKTHYDALRSMDKIPLKRILISLSFTKYVQIHVHYSDVQQRSKANWFLSIIECL